MFSFNSCVYYLIRGFIDSTRAFNLLTCVLISQLVLFNVTTRAFSLITRGFELVTRRIELVTRKAELVICEFELADLNS